MHRYHYKCLKIARGKFKEEEKYTCPICDWRMKIPRDASRPKLEDLVALVDEIRTLPFQPEEEGILRDIIDNAQGFRDFVAQFCTPETEVGTQRFYLRKLEGAEVLLSYETNLFRQELHRRCPVAPEAPPILEVSLSTRKPRPTKLQKMLAEYGVENPDDLPDHAKGKANSLRRKAANAEAAAAAAAAAQSQGGAAARPPTSHGSHTGHYSSSSPQGPSVALASRSGRSTSLSEDDRLHSDPMDLDATKGDADDVDTTTAPRKDVEAPAAQDKDKEQPAPKEEAPKAEDGAKPDSAETKDSAKPTEEKDSAEAKDRPATEAASDKEAKADGAKE